MFHSVWKNKNNILFDITPRIDNEEVILFVPDEKREIVIKVKDEKIIINSFDNFRIQNHLILNGIRKLEGIVKSSHMKALKLIVSNNKP